jgi:transcriptional regulator with GAF, ATPase, and Fis domain
MQSATRLQLLDGSTAVLRSPVMHRLMAMVERVAHHQAAVLIVGETGVGKELVARAIHEQSSRKGKAFVDVNCAALPEHLVESELFGFEKGAFSGADTAKPGLFELADGGTIFLDEIGELDIKIQAKLLRVLDGVPYYRLGGSRKVAVNVRVIAATNRHLEEESKSGKFREDLYHRLTQLQLHVPPLRERAEDIDALAEHFLHSHCLGARFTADAAEALRQYAWPGNVRELKNVIFKTTLNAKPGKTEFQASDLPAAVCGVSPAPEQKAVAGNLDDMERQMIFRALEDNGNNQSKAAQQLGISSRTLRRKLEKYRAMGIEIGKSGRLGKLSAQQQRYFRVTIEIPVTIKDEEGNEGSAVGVNISSGGIAIKSPAALKHGTTYDLSFHLPGISAQLESRGKLAWTSPGGLAGLSFVDMHPVFQKQLQQWLVERAGQEGWVEQGPSTSL